jgi:uncharacterized protein YdaT
VFVTACHKKAWDHFTKAQRKNLEIWRKQATEVKNALLEEALAERNEEEMDFSDSESEDMHNGESIVPRKKPRMDDKHSMAVNQLKVCTFNSDTQLLWRRRD